MSRTWDVIGIIGIIVMIAGGIFVYIESKKCENPLQTIIQVTMEDAGIGSDINYSYVTLSFYDGVNIFPYAEYNVYYNGKIQPLTKTFTSLNSS